MRRAVMLMMLVALSVAVVGCAPSGNSDGTGDGLHPVVPDVTGMPLAEARAALENEGYVVGEVTGDTPDDPSAIVVEQSPVAATSVPRETTIDLRVAAGP